MCVPYYGLFFFLPFVLLGSSTSADTNHWTNAKGGSWQDKKNWSAAIVPSGTNVTAKFDGLSLTMCPIPVTLDETFALGSLVVSNTAAIPGTPGYIFSGETLTMADTNGLPEIFIGDQTGLTGHSPAMGPFW